MKKWRLRIVVGIIAGISLLSCSTAPSPRELFLYGKWTNGRQMRYDQALHQVIPGKDTITEIWAYDIQKKKHTKVFSDENEPIAVIGSHGNAFSDPNVVSAKGKLYVYARTKNKGPDILYSDKGDIYEIECGPPVVKKKVYQPEGSFPTYGLYITNDGSKIGFFSFSFEGYSRKKFICVVETASGKMISKIDVSKDFLDCYAPTMGWLPDNETMYFTLHTGDIHVTSEESYKQVGNYSIKYDGTNLTKLDKQLFAWPSKPGFLDFREVPVWYSAGKDGTSLFRALLNGRGGYHSYLYLINTKTGLKKEVELAHNHGEWQLNVSPDGKYLAYILDELSPSWQESDIQIWLKNLTAENCEETLVLEIKQEKPEPQQIGIVGWLEQ